MKGDPNAHTTTTSLYQCLLCLIGLPTDNFNDDPRPSRIFDAACFASVEDTNHIIGDYTPSASETGTKCPITAEHPLKNTFSNGLAAPNFKGA